MSAMDKFGNYMCNWQILCSIGKFGNFGIISNFANGKFGNYCQLANLAFKCAINKFGNFAIGKLAK